MTLRTQSTIIKEVVKSKIQRLGTAHLYNPSTMEETGTAELVDLTGEWLSTPPEGKRTKEWYAEALRARDKADPANATQVAKIRPSKETIGSIARKHIQRIISKWPKH